MPRFLRRVPSNAPEDEKLAHFVGLFRAIGRIDDARELAVLTERLRGSIRRAYRPDGTLRQLLAVTADRDRRPELARVKCPALIVHGTLDPLVPVGAAKALREALPHARFEAIDRLGHYLPEWAVPRLAELVATAATRG